MKKFILGTLLVIVALVIAGLIIVKAGWTPEALSPVMAYFQEEEQTTISAAGNVEVREVDVGFTLSGRIEQVFAEEGQEVKQGEKLAVIEQTEMNNTVMKNRGALNEATARLEDLESGSRQQEIETAEAQVAAVESRLTKVREDFDRAEALYNDGFLSEAERDAARTTYQATLAEYEQAQEQLDLVRAGPTEETLSAAQARVTQAKAALRIAEEQLSDTTIYAPISGVILKKNMEAGEIASPGVPVYTIGNLAQPWVTVYIREDKLGLVKLQQAAEVSVDSYPDKVYPGTVTYIASDAEFTPKNVRTKEERVKLVFEVEVSVENPNGELKPGMPADVEILLSDTTTN